MRDAITSFLENESTPTFSSFLGGSTDKRVEMSTYRNYRVMDIRVMIPGTGTSYGTYFPTKKGFNVNRQLWTSIVEQYDRIVMFLNETKRVHELIKENVTSQLREIIRKSCNGCVIDHPSQLQHACLELDWGVQVQENHMNYVKSLNMNDAHNVFLNHTFLNTDFCKQMLTIIICSSKQLI